MIAVHQVLRTAIRAGPDRPRSCRGPRRRGPHDGGRRARGRGPGRAIEQRARGCRPGLGVAEAVFARVDPELHWDARERRAAGASRAAGRDHRQRRSILAGERVALNFLGRLSGVATLTARYVQAVEGTGVRILDTRKTTPGLRALEKEAGGPAGA